MSDLPTPEAGAMLRLGVLPQLGFQPKAILDIGAFEARWSHSIREIFPNAYIMMIEALEEKEPYLQDACQRLGNMDYKISLLGEKNLLYKNFFVVDAPNGTSDGICQTGSSRYPENSLHPKKPRAIPQKTLDKLLAVDHHIFDFMKIDVQGSELDVLAGAEDHLGNLQFIQMELSALEYNQGAPSFAEVIAKMNGYGFVLFDIIQMMYGGVFLMQFDTLFVRRNSPYRPDLSTVKSHA